MMNTKSLALFVTLIICAFTAVTKDLVTQVPVFIKIHRAILLPSHRRYIQDILTLPMTVENCIMCLLNPPVWLLLTTFLSLCGSMEGRDALPF